MTTWDEKRRLMRRYDQSARVYDVQYFEEQEAKIKAIMRNVSLRQNRVLDAGCGTGLLLSHLADKTKLIVGIDISRGLLQEAKKKARHYTNASLVLADADSAPFLDGAFDAVFAVTVLQNAPKPEVTVAEIKRVGKGSAQIVVTGLKKRFTQEDFPRMLTRAGLKVVTLEQDEKNREYVCICLKARR